MTTIKEATELYNYIQTMLNNDYDALMAYHIRVWYENTPMNDGPKTETDKLLEALGVVLVECAKKHNTELLRMAATFSCILEHMCPHIFKHKPKMTQK